jgi:3-deoxy-manno-octulosonate cytidylyltransferase (CMP-KDO synthetase)
MTADTHKRASDRVAEAMLKIEQDTKEKIDIVAMIQGDEPMIYPEMIKEAVIPLMDNRSEVFITNLMAPLDSKQNHEDPNEIKVVVDKNNFALYFSREPIPSGKKEPNKDHTYKQVCIIPFTRDFLLKFNELEPTPLEIIESIDMLRLLEHGYKVLMVPTAYKTYSVDTPEDLAYVEQMMKNDKLYNSYGV